MTERERHLEMTWFLIPRKDENHQWWWGYRKMNINISPESEKLKLLEKMRRTSGAS